MKEPRIVVNQFLETNFTDCLKVIGFDLGSVSERELRLYDCLVEIDFCLFLRNSRMCVT